MLHTYETDEEKVEAIKKWWKDNSVSLVAGVVLGLGAVFGWRAWVDYRDQVSQRASAAFEQLLASVRNGETEAARAQATALEQDFDDTAYVALAALARARLEVEAGDAAAARAALEQAIATAPEPSMARIAALRLGRVLIAEGQLETAAAVIDRHDDGGPLSGEFDALRGDLAAQAGRADEARAAYERALAKGATQAEALRLKRDNLPPAG